MVDAYGEVAFIKSMIEHDVMPWIFIYSGHFLFAIKFCRKEWYKLWEHER